MSMLSSRLLVASALLSVLLISSASPAAAWDPSPTTPVTGVPYRCMAKKIIDPNAEWLKVRLTFNQFPCRRLADGNTLCRPIYGVSPYPDHPTWPPLNTLLTVAKPESCGRHCSSWEYTINRPFTGQCKRFKAFEEQIGRRWIHFLQFAECSTGWVQTCVLPASAEPKPIPGVH